MSIVEHTQKDNRFNLEKHFAYGPEEGFKENGYVFKAFQPDVDATQKVVVIQALKDNQIVEELLVPLFHDNLVGLDIEDRGAVEAATETLVSALA